MKNYNLPVEGMTCASCVTRVEKIVSKFDGVKNVNVNLATERITFDTDNANLDLSPIAAAVEDYGYKLKLDSDSSNKTKTDEDTRIEENDEYFD